MTLAFVRPPTLEEAFAELDDEDALVFAGGQSIVLLMNIGLLRPAKLVAITGLGELAGVHLDDGVLDVGATSTHHELAHDPLVTRHIPVAAEMLSGVGNARVRASGTLGGNLAHADPAQDPAVVLTTLGADAVVAGPAGPRTVPVADLALGPFVPALEDSEILKRVRVPVPAAGTACAYEKFLSGSQDDYATVSIAARVTYDRDGLVAGADMAAGAAGPTVVPLGEPAQLLMGQSVTDGDVVDAVMDAVRDAVAPQPDRRGSADYKREMAAVVAARALAACAREHPGTGDPTDGGRG